MCVVHRMRVSKCVQSGHLIGRSTLLDLHLVCFAPAPLCSSPPLRTTLTFLTISCFTRAHSDFLV